MHCSNRDFTCLLTATVWLGICFGCGGDGGSAGGGVGDTNTNGDGGSGNTNTNTNENGRPSICDEPGTEIAIEGLPEGQVGPDSTLRLYAVICSGNGDYNFEWNWSGPEDEADLGSPTEQETILNFFSEGEFTIMLTATNAQSGAMLSTQAVVEAVIGGPPFNE